MGQNGGGSIKFKSPSANFFTLSTSRALAWGLAHTCSKKAFRVFGKSDLIGCPVFLFVISGTPGECDQGGLP